MAQVLQQLGGWYHAMVQVCPQSTLTTYRGDMQCVPHRGGSLSVASPRLNHPQFILLSFVLFLHSSGELQIKQEDLLYPDSLRDPSLTPRCILQTMKTTIVQLPSLLTTFK